MEKEIIISKFRLKQYIIDKSIFDYDGKELSSERNIGFDVKGTIKNNNIFELTLGTKIADENKSLKIFVQVVATYEFDSDIAPDLLSDMFYKNAPAIIFPYVRAYVSSLTVLSGIDAINIPTMNLSSIADDLKNNTQKE
ncbi:protein-export chaperone SecB [Bacteroides nordii]|uniref:protein-export chaperone SecB n=1 Tax=Bacteroides nordii TaxID=291645 RepID=UPI002A84080C|nr:protein-export chaperone SecB [Bacteroides nordii]